MGREDRFRRGIKIRGGSGRESNREANAKTRSVAIRVDAIVVAQGNRTSFLIGRFFAVLRIRGRSWQHDSSRVARQRASRYLRLSLCSIPT